MTEYTLWRTGPDGSVGHRVHLTPLDRAIAMGQYRNQVGYTILEEKRHTERLDERLKQGAITVEHLTDMLKEPNK